MGNDQRITRAASPLFACDCNDDVSIHTPQESRCPTFLLLAIRYRGRSEFLFPPRTRDGTTSRLVMNSGDAFAPSIENELGLPKNALGRLYEVDDVAL